MLHPLLCAGSLFPHWLGLQLELPQTLLLTLFISGLSFRGNSSMIFPWLWPLSSFTVYNINNFCLSVCLTMTSSIYSCPPCLQVFHHPSSLQLSTSTLSYLLFFKNFFHSSCCSHSTFPLFFLYFFILNNYRLVNILSVNERMRERESSLQDLPPDTFWSHLT